jgi:hypothetical protein
MEGGSVEMESEAIAEREEEDQREETHGGEGRDKLTVNDGLQATGDLGWSSISTSNDLQHLGQHLLRSVQGVHRLRPGLHFLSAEIETCQLEDSRIDEGEVWLDSLQETVRSLL